LLAGETGYPALHVGGAEQGIGWVHDQLWQKFLPAQTAISRFSRLGISRPVEPPRIPAARTASNHPELFPRIMSA
jgi:hypothetical protein